MKRLWIIALSLLSCAVFAQERTTADGNWLKRMLDATDRVLVTNNGTQQDLLDSVTLQAYVSGMLTVHRQNNLEAVIAYKLLSQKKDKDQADLGIRVASRFAPLINIPDSLGPQQIVAILRKYLDAHPERWNSQASALITDALKDSYPPKW